MEPELILHFKSCHCIDGFVTLIGCPTIDDENTFSIIGIGSAQKLAKSITLAKQSASRYLGIDQGYFILNEVGASAWMFPEEDFLDVEKAFYEI